MDSVVDAYLFEIGLLIDSIKSKRVVDYVNDVINPHPEWNFNKRDFSIDEIKNSISNKISTVNIPLALNQIDDLVRKLGEKYLLLENEIKELDKQSAKFFKQNGFEPKKPTKESDLFFMACGYVNIQFFNLINVLEFLYHKCEVLNIDFRNITLTNFGEKNAELINKHIQDYKYKLTKDNLSIMQQDTPPGPEIDLDIDAALKICLLKELGIFDLLIQKGLSSNNKMAKLIDFLTKEPITTGAANMALSRIQHEGLMEKYQSEIAALKLKYGITK